MKTYSVSEIANFLKATCEGNLSLHLHALGRIESTNPGEITFLAGKAYEHYLENCSDCCILVSKNSTLKPASNQAFIYVDHPHAAFAALIDFLYPQSLPIPGIHPSAIIHESAIIGENVTIHPGVVIEKKCSIGSGCIIEANVVIKENTVIGNNSRLYPNVVCYQHSVIGEHCIIHAGAVIGADGFGYIEHKDGSYTKITHAGNVVLGDNVEIGANTTIDRSVVGSTIIEDGVKIDNLVQIAHNVSIGEHTAIASQCGIAGSAHIGARNRLAGQVGSVGHITTAEKVIVLGQSGIAQSIEKSGIYFGSPAIERSKEMRRITASQQLPEMFRSLHELEAKIKKIEELISESQKTS